MDRIFWTVFVTFVVTLSACGSGAPAAEPHTAARVSKVPPVKSGPSQLERAQVVEVVRAGLGRFLQKVEVEPSFEAGKFRGFRLVSLRPPSFWQGVDLKPGDVVLSVNGMPIERETQAYDAFQSLLSAKELRVDYLREGRAQRLVYPIVETQK